MKSTILTKVNTTVLAFKDQVTELKGEGDFKFLKEFVNLLHGKQKETEIQIQEGKVIDVFTTKKAYMYKIYPKYIMRCDISNGKKTFYKIS